MDVRENGQDLEEIIRSCVAGLMKNYWHVMPAQVTDDSQDGHVASVQPTIKRAVTNPVDGSTTYEDHPVHPDAPIHHLGGGGISMTHPTKKDDGGAILYASRNIDSWFQSGGSQQSMDDRMHSIGDALFLSGIRSIPKKLAQVSQSSSQMRTDDKKSVIDHSSNGTHHKTVDPSTQAASESFDPFASATKFFEHILHPTNGHAVNATDGGTTHSSTLDHDNGFKAAANNGAHSISAHPSNGTSILSDVAHTLQAPNASLDKSGNQSNQGSSTSKGDISSSSGNVSAPSGNVSGMAGQFASGFLGLLKFAGGGFSGPPSSSGALTVNSGLAAAPVLQSNATYTVASLLAEMPPTAALIGTRAVVTDAVGTTTTNPDGTTSATATVAFMSILQGGGTTVAPAWCDGVNWLCA